MRQYTGVQMSSAGFDFGVAATVFAVLLIITVAVDIVMRVDIHPSTRFRSMVSTTLLAGLAASVLIEIMDLHILG